MNSKPAHTLGVVGVALLAALSPTAASAHPSDADTPTQASSALLVRSEALNQQLHLGRSASASTQASSALLVRSGGLNQRFGLGATSHTDQDSPDWTTLGIAAFGVAAAGALVASAAAAGRRRPAGLAS